jgi:uncharacterized membrane protein
MSEHILGYLEQAGVVISLAAVAIIVVGFVLASGRYVLRWLDVTLDRNFKQFKVDLAHALTLGLEILVLADVIETIILEITFQSLAVLAFLVVVRTIVSWTLVLESEGRWPWQASAEEQTHA